MQSPPVNSIIPAISGAPSRKFNKFWDNVTCDENGNATHGSLGIHFWIQEDLRTVERQYQNDENEFKAYLLRNMVTVHPEFGNGKTRNNADRLLQMYKFMKDPAQKFFFIKKGTKCIYLAEKTRGYYFEEQPNHEWGRHRIDFKVIRQTRGDETIPQLGRGISTWMTGGMKVLY
jgi:hypothetical protein